MSRNLTDALSKLYIKLGGQTSNIQENKDVVDYIDDITDTVTPGGGGDSDIFVVEMVPTSGDSLSSNKTLDEMKEAYASGKKIIGWCRDTGIYSDPTSGEEDSTIEIIDFFKPIISEYEWVDDDFPISATVEGFKIDYCRFSTNDYGTAKFESYDIIANEDGFTLSKKYFTIDLDR